MPSLQSIPTSHVLLKKLEQFHPKIIDLSLDRMYRLLQALDNPQLSLKNVILIGGTNGKGSVCENLRAMLSAVKQSVNCYTSPHLIDFNERIRLNTAYISENILCQILREIEEKNNNQSITFFEATTAAALKAFANDPSDYTILECGLGGRLDATNVVDKPIATILTKISYDHEEYLGNTLTKIAYEKSGLIKPLAPIVSAEQDEEALSVIKQTATRLHCPLYIHKRDFHIQQYDDYCIFKVKGQEYSIPLPSLKGEHQYENLALALFTCFHIANQPTICEEKTIKHALVNVNWPARLMCLEQGFLHNQLPQNTDIWLDGGHNEDAAKALSHFIKNQKNKKHTMNILFWSMLNNKKHDAFIKNFEGLFDYIIVLPIPNEQNSATTHTLFEIAHNYFENVVSLSTIEQACDFVKNLPKQKRIVIHIIGSLYMAGHVLKTHSY